MDIEDVRRRPLGSHPPMGERGEKTPARFAPSLGEARGSGTVVIAPDKFKGSLNALAVAEAIARGLRRSAPEVAAVLHPVADGGDGFVAGLLHYGFRRRAAIVSDPLGRPIRAAYAIRQETAVIELAAASGMDLLTRSELDPLNCSTYGTGQLIAEAVAQGARYVVMGAGGSATCDGGVGMLCALGARLLDPDGHPLPPEPASLGRVDRVDLSGIAAAVRDARIMVASDVTNSLLGNNGAIMVFGPQKGAVPEQLETLELRMQRWADAVERSTGRHRRDHRGSGAAGGSSFALASVFDAAIVPGIELFLDLSEFKQVLTDARLVITGEGRLDEQTLGGKAPLGVCRSAARHGVRTVAVVGSTTLSAQQIRQSGFAGVFTLESVEADEQRSIRDAADLLSTVSSRLARHYLSN